MRTYILTSYYKSASFFANIAGSEDFVFINYSFLSHQYLRSLGRQSKLFGLLFAFILPRKLLARKVSNQIIKKIKKDGAMDKFRILIWAGIDVLGDAARIVKENYPNCSILFFEKSNFPSKIIVDGDGVNVRSSLYRNSKILEDFCFNTEKCDEWIFNFNKGLVDAIPFFNFPQKSKLMMLLELSWLSIFFRPYPNSLLRYFYLFSNKLRSNKVPSFVPDQPFNIFALQVRSDTQLTHNSTISTLQAIEKVLKETAIPLVLCNHPVDIGHAESILRKISDRSRVFISPVSTTELAKNAITVYTVNSSIGAECILKKIPVIFMGESLFSGLSYREMRAYICGYLYDLEYDSSGHYINNFF